MSAAMPAVVVVDFSAIQAGHRATIRKLIQEEDVQAFAASSGDRNPLHMREDFARATSFRRRVVHGMLLGSYVSQLIGERLPGAGALWLRQRFEWRVPVFIGDTVEITATVKQVSNGSRTIELSITAVNQRGETVMDGEGLVTLVELHERTPDRKLEERVAVVTGASRGIGALIATQLAAAGVRVTVNYRDSRALAERLCAQIENGGGRAIAIQADVADSEQVARLVDQAAAVFGDPVDLLINNAGAAPAPKSFASLTWRDCQAIFDVQLRGAFQCCQAVIPDMVERKSGRIVNVGFSLGRGSSSAQLAGFVMAKAALRALTRSLADELGPSGIRVNVVSPGFQEAGAGSMIPERLRKVHAMQSPLRRLAAAEDVARAVVFLCGDGGELITGAELPVGGGCGI